MAAQPSTVGKRPPTPDPKDQECPHKHFKIDVIDRSILSKRQHLNLLSTPKGYVWIVKQKTPQEGEDTVGNERELWLRKLKCMRKKKSPKEAYLYNFLAEVWSLLTPEMITRLRDMLVQEFGMTEEEALRFVCEQRAKALAGADKKRPGEDEDIPDRNIAEKNKDEKLPRFFVDEKPCESGEYAIKVDPCEVREVSKVIATKLTQYINFMLNAKRDKRQRKMAEVILHELCLLTGEKCTLDNPKNRLQKILSFGADRIALWLAQNFKDEYTEILRRRKKEDAELKKKQQKKLKEREWRDKEFKKLGRGADRRKMREAKEREDEEKRKKEEAEKRKRDDEKRRKKLTSASKDKGAGDNADKKDKSRPKSKESGKKGDKKKPGSAGDKDKRKADKSPAAGDKSRGDGKGQQGPGKGQQGGSKGQQGAGKGQQGAGKGQQGAGKGQQGAGKGQQGGGKGQQGASKGQQGASKGQQGAGKGQQGANKGPQGASKPQQGGDKGRTDVTKNEVGGESGDADKARSDAGEASASERDKSEAPASESDRGGVSGAETKGEEEETTDKRKGDETDDSEAAKTAESEKEEPVETGPVPAAMDAEKSPERKAEESEAGEQEQQITPGPTATETREEEDSGIGETPQAGVTPQTAVTAESDVPQKIDEKAKDGKDKKDDVVDRSQAESIAKSMSQQILDATVSSISKSETVATPRQEALTDVISKMMEKHTPPKDEDTAAMLREMAAKVATWIDKHLDEVESEYGEWPKVIVPVAQRPKGPLFHVRKSDDHYKIRRATHTEAEKQVRLARGTSPTAPSSNAQSWTRWAIETTQMAENWGRWIDNTVREAEGKALKYKEMGPQKETDAKVKEDWTRFKDKTGEEALEWRRNKKMLEEVAQLWKEKAGKPTPKN